MKNKRACIIFIILLTIVDQIIKYNIELNVTNSIPIIKNVLDISYIQNRGGAFGIGYGEIIFFIILNTILIGLMFYYIVKTNKKGIVISLSCIIAGGTSNLIDRIFRGYVVDYIDINNLLSYPVFNIADMLIVIGTILLAINIIKEK